VDVYGWYNGALYIGPYIREVFAHLGTIGTEMHHACIGHGVKMSVMIEPKVTVASSNLIIKQWFLATLIIL
jgi:hypothetical protein